MIDLEQQLSEHLERKAAAVTPRYDLDAIVRSSTGVEQPGNVRLVDFRRRNGRPNSGPILGVLGVAAAVALIVAAVVIARDDDASLAPAVSTPTTVAATPWGVFAGNWTSTDIDGSVQTMELTFTAEGSAQLTQHDGLASAACAGAPSTLTGTGELSGVGELVITLDSFTCDDGTEPAVPVEDLSLYRLSYQSQSDTLVDSTRVVWARETAEEGPARSHGAMWPQSNLDEVRAAQERADADDPAFTWQLDPNLTAGDAFANFEVKGAQPDIVERFLRQELGWDQFVFNPYLGENGDASESAFTGLVYIKCAPGATNPLYPTDPNGGCAPTMDDTHYETVQLNLAQLDRQDSTGIWVVNGWTMITPFAQADPAAVQAEASALLDEFLAERLAGKGAEDKVLVSGGSDYAATNQMLLLYATTAGAPYERYEIARVGQPQWPFADMDYVVRLFANGGETVVEQPIAFSGGGDQPLLMHNIRTTTENGEPVPVPYAFFDSRVVTASAATPWKPWVWNSTWALTYGEDSSSRIDLLGDPLSGAGGCMTAAAPADVNALAASLRADPDLEVSTPIAVTVGGIDGLVMDVTTATGATTCEGSESSLLLTNRNRDEQISLEHGSSMRVYLLDLPNGSANRTIAIAISAPEERFDEVLSAAGPVIASIQFH